MVANTHSNDPNAAWSERAGEGLEQEAAEREGPAASDQLAALESEIARLKDERLRALAEVENVRRRAQRDRQEASQYAISAFARDLLTVADNLQRALAAVNPEARAADPALDALVNGLEITERQLLAILDRYGVKPIEAEGALFDPHLHEAMFEIPNESVPQGTILQVLERGYLLHDRTLRPSRVGIARGGPKPVIPSDAGRETGGPARTAGDPYQRPERGEDAPGSRMDETL